MVDVRQVAGGRHRNRPGRARRLVGVTVAVSALALGVAISTTPHAVARTAPTAAPAAPHPSSLAAAKVAGAQRQAHAAQLAHGRPITGTNSPTRAADPGVTPGLVMGTHWRTGQASALPAVHPANNAANAISYGPSTYQYYGGRVLHTNETYVVFWDPDNQMPPDTKG